MKKKYEKPVLITEEFQLDTATAASTCRADATEQKLEYIKLGYNANTCAYDNGQFFSDMIKFIENDMTGAVIRPGTGGSLWDY